MPNSLHPYEKSALDKCEPEKHQLMINACGRTKTLLVIGERDPSGDGRTKVGILERAGMSAHIR